MTTRALRVLSLCAVLLVVLSSADGQSIWNGGTGNWSDAADWSTGVVPNSSTVDVRIDNGNPAVSVVTYDLTSGSVGDLVLDSDDTLAINGALTSYYATLTSGTLNVNSAGSFINNGLLNNYGTIQGDGLITNNGSFNNNAGGSVVSGINNNLGATLTNYAGGDLEPTFGTNNGTINNFGGLETFGPPSSYTNNGIFNNFSHAIIFGPFYNSGTFNNASGGTLSNLGIINNTGMIDSRGNIEMSGPLTNSGVINIAYSGSLDDNGPFYNYGTFVNNGQMSINGGIFDNYGVATNSYSISAVGASAVLSNYGILNNTGTLDNVGSSLFNYGTLNNIGTLISLVVSFENHGILNNTGLIGLDDSDELFNYGDIFNSGMINATNTGGPVGFYNNGTIVNSNAFNLEGVSIINNGTIINTGQITTINIFETVPNVTVTNAGIIINQGSFNNDGELTNSGVLINSPGAFINSGSGIAPVAIANSGTIANGGTISNLGDMTNSGVVTILPGGVLSNSGGYTQAAGETITDGLLAGKRILIEGGLLSGNGYVQGDVVLGGIISPGDSPGRLTIQGNYTQLASGTFFAELAGLTPGTEYDQLVVSGTAALDGTLDVVLLNGFVVQLGDSFVLMTFSNETGQFSMLDLPKLSTGEMWRVSYNATDLTLSVMPTPEPSTFVLLGSGLLGMAGMLRRKLVGWI